MSAFRLLSALLLVATLGACAGAAHRVPLVSEGDVAAASSEIAQSPGLQPVKRSQADNRDLVMAAARRLQGVAGPLCEQVDHSPCRFNVMYDPSDEMNAYAEGDDTVVIYDGLVRYLRTEDEVAAVVAHEMGHHIAGHIEKSEANVVTGVVVSALLYTAVMAAVVASGGDGAYIDPQIYSDGLDSSTQLGATVGVLSFSKEHEREADYLAAYLLARAGYDLEQARGLWVQLSKSSDDMQTDMFDTHPAGPDRLAAWDLAVIEVSASGDLLPEVK